jgi:GDPmannose 4,6-dehydratase
MADMTAGATAVITGITGQDGHYLADQLLREAVDVHGVVRAGTKPTDVRPTVTIHPARLTDAESVAAVVDAVEPDFVFHLAGMSSVAASWENPVYATEVNALSTAALLDACVRTQDRTGKSIVFVNASSCEIFAGSPDSPQTENTPIRPISPYGASKVLGHSLCQVYRARGLEASNAILYNHESPRRPTRYVTRSGQTGPPGTR